MQPSSTSKFPYRPQDNHAADDHSDPASPTKECGKRPTDMWWFDMPKKKDENVVGIAETGSHKMLAYVLPAVIHDSRHPPRQRHEGPIAVLLAPTREVAKQIHSMAYELGKHAAERIVCAANGERKKSKYAELQGGCHIFVATPRCLIEFLEEGQVNLHRCTYLVFDEVDRMLSMGYQRHVLKIVELCRPDRQTLMWATS
ncbi:ATP-dependent RNA helicase p62 [Rhipicephalus sanguineus]|uniref:ATP-dependent RNA helicase p62 n=1 Tax=Rhipicephalus sanguineus TaxID=34632 RepID=UPI00189344A5|nr:ATP-dependent RNA helicase p62 [Rhipicephalus sanguineus]